MTDTVSQKPEQAFKPEQHLMPITRREKQADGSYQAVTKQYLPVAPRLQWFRDDYPMGEIKTTVKIVTLPDGGAAALARARVLVDGKQLGSGSGLCTPTMWTRWCEKAETTAVGRALAAAGYGTQFCGEDDWDEGAPDGIVDSPVDRHPKVAAPPAASRGAPPMRQTASSSVQRSAPPSSSGNGASPRQQLNNGPQFPDRPATEPQIKAIYAIARGAKSMDDREIDEWCKARFQKLPAELSRKEASEAIDAIRLGASA